MNLDYFIGAGISFRNRDYTIHSVEGKCHNYSISPLLFPGHFTENKILFSVPFGFRIALKIHEKH